MSTIFGHLPAQEACHPKITVWKTSHATRQSWRFHPELLLSPFHGRRYLQAGSFFQISAQSPNPSGPARQPDDSCPRHSPKPAKLTVLSSFLMGGELTPYQVANRRSLYDSGLETSSAKIKSATVVSGSVSGRAHSLHQAPCPRAGVAGMAPLPR